MMSKRKQGRSCFIANGAFKGSSLHARCGCEKSRNLRLSEVGIPLGKEGSAHDRNPIRWSGSLAIPGKIAGDQMRLPRGK